MKKKPLWVGMLVGSMCLSGSPVFAQTLATPPGGRGLTESQLARLDPKVESTSVLIEVSKELLKNDQLEEALPFLSELLIRLEGDESKKGQQTLAFTLFQLAHCQMKLGEYVSAGKNFIRFADEFPEDPQYFEARVLAAQSLTMVQQWPLVEEQALIALENVRLEEDLRVNATQLLAEARYQQEMWGEAIKPLLALFRIAQKDSARSSAAVMLVTCYVRLDDFNSLFKFIPQCDSDARHDVGLNVALLEAGDSHYNKKEFQKALLLYRLVMGKQELVEHYETRLREMKAQMKPYVADGKQTLTEFKEKQKKQEERFERASRHYQAIRDFQDYDMELALRIAQCYNDLGRNWPAHAIYQRIFTENPTNSIADQARFSAFSVMLDENEWKLAVNEGEEYLRKLPEGDYVDEITLNLMQVHLQQGQFELAYEAGEKGLKLSPDHRHMDQIKYLLGYIDFSEMDYDIALELFTEVHKRWPDGKFHQASEYWRAMSLLFLGRFGDAVTAFSAYLTNPKYADERTFEEDASYRLGIAQYGAELDRESEETLRAFVEKFPESLLRSEAYAMLGDLRGQAGDMDEALTFFGLARETATGVAQVNYPLFQEADVLYKLKRYEEIVSLMDDYLKTWGGKGDFPNAANWKGKAHKALDEYVRALGAYFDTVDEFGDNADLAGIDVIMNSVVDDYHSDEWKAYREVIVEKLNEHLAYAQENRTKTLELHYLTVLSKIVPEEARQEYIDQIVQSRNVPSSGASTLVLIAQEAAKSGDYELVHEAYNRFMSTFEISNNMLYVMLAELDALAGEGSNQDALDLTETILNKFGYASKSVGIARKKRGDIFRSMGDFEHAIEAYKEVIGIREWRGELTPEALYGIGQCKMALDKFDEAFAFFQRIYVLYEGYTDWVAPAYLLSIECLEKLGGHEQDIIKTYQEMLAIEAVAATPEGRKARERLNDLVPAEEVL